MSIELVKVTKNTRGKDSHQVTYEAVGNFTTKTVNKEVVQEDKTIKIVPTEEQVFESAGVLTDINDALDLPLIGGDKQKMLDCLADGYNRLAYSIESNKDELDPYVIGMDEDTANANKRAIRALAKATGLTLIEAADIVKASRKTE